MARRQHWVVARRQLLALGFSPREIEGRVAGRLHPGVVEVSVRRPGKIFWPAGFARLRFTHWQVKYERGHVRQILGETAARLA